MLLVLIVVVALGKGRCRTQPQRECASAYVLEPYEGYAIWDSFYAIMERLGNRYAWRREDGSVTLTFERDSSWQRASSRPEVLVNGRTIETERVA